MNLQGEFDDYWATIETPKIQHLKEFLRVTFYAGAIAACTTHVTGTSMEDLVGQIGEANVGFDLDTWRQIH